MKGIDFISVIAGIIMVLGGLILLVASFFLTSFLMIYAVVLLILGIVILATLKQQEHIEPIKTERNKNQRLHRRV